MLQQERWAEVEAAGGRCAAIGGDAPDAEDLHQCVQRSLNICRQLYGRARSASALPFASASLSWATALDDPELRQRALAACGLLLADIGNVAAAIDIHRSALDWAERRPSPIEVSRAWNNIGASFIVSGHARLAAQCFQHSLEAASDIRQPLQSRLAALGNLALCQFDLGEFDQGLESGVRALEESTAEIAAQDPHGQLLLHRNLVRLFLANRMPAEAQRHLQQVTVLASAANTDRAHIALATVRGACELVTGAVDLGLTRLSEALERARRLPSAFRDTLMFVAWAELQAGCFDNYHRYQRELADHVYDDAIRKARLNVGLAETVGTLPFSSYLSPNGMAALGTREDKAHEWDVLVKLGMSADLRTDHTGGHGRRVGALTKALAMEAGYGPLEALELGRAAELHDVGMLCVPEHHCLSAHRLSEAARSIVGRHSEAGASILSTDPHPSFRLAADISRYHHCHWDGNGHPGGVMGAGIPAGARLCAIADAYDSMVTQRPWREAMSLDEARQEIRRHAGSQFDPSLAEHFENLILRESQDIGLDTAQSNGPEGFEALILSISDHRGFL